MLKIYELRYPNGLFAIALFAVSSSVTPEPNNIMVMTSGVNFGVRKSIPLFADICVGFTILLLLVGLGFGMGFSVLCGIAVVAVTP